MKRVLGILIVLAMPALLGAGYFLFTGAGQDVLMGRLAKAGMSRSFPPDLDGLRVIMCGTSSPLPAPDRDQTCAIVMAGQRMFLVDAGAGSPRTATLGLLPLERLSTVLLTHFHSDHIAALYDFNLNSWVAGRREPLKVIGPAGVGSVVGGINAADELDRGYRVAHHGAELLPPELGVMEARSIEPGLILDEDGLRITAFAVDHRPVRPAFGYRFDYRGRSVALSGDAIVDESLLEGVRGVDLLLQDAISLPIIGALEEASAAVGNRRQARILQDIQDYHAPTGSLHELVTDARVSRLAIYHFVPPPRGGIMRRIFRRGLPAGTILTEDGMILDLPAGTDEVQVR